MGRKIDLRHLVLSVAILLLPLAGCAGHRQPLEACYSSARAGNYEQALSGLRDSSLARSNGSRLLYLMEKGLLLHLQGEYRESNIYLEEADHLATELFTRSLSAESLSFISNDGVIPYAGADYESTYLNYYKALNYLALGDLESARIEARKVDEKLNYFTDTYGGRNVFKENAFLRLLTGLIYEAEGDTNNAFIAYRLSLQAYRAYEEKYRVPVPAQLWGRLLSSARRTGLTDEYELHLEEARAAQANFEESETLIAVILDHGFVPVKREAFVFVPTEHGFPVKLAMPQFESRPPPKGTPLVSLGTGEWIRPERVEDVGAIARKSLEDKYGRIMTKMIARAVAKQVAARRAEKEFGPLAGFLAQVTALVTEEADLRSWTLLPDQVLLAIIPVTPGTHTVVIAQGDLRETHEIDVRKGGVGFVMTRIR
jgi:uncharacterized protein